MKTLYKDIDENTKNQITKNALTSWFVSALVTVNVLVIQGSIFVLCVVFLKEDKLDYKNFIIALAYV